LPVLTPNVSGAQQSNAAVTVIAVGICIALLYFGRVFLITVVIAVILAFLLDPGVRLVMKLKVPRAFASFVVCSVALLFVYLAGLGIYTEALAMVDDLPAYSARITEIVESVATKVDEIERRTYQLVVPQR
jgi:predicted PurR-regulated permease PerM